MESKRKINPYLLVVILFFMVVLLAGYIIVEHAFTEKKEGVVCDPLPEEKPSLPDIYGSYQDRDFERLTSILLFDQTCGVSVMNQLTVSINNGMLVLTVDGNLYKTNVLNAKYLYWAPCVTCSDGDFYYLTTDQELYRVNGYPIPDMNSEITTISSRKVMDQKVLEFMKIEREGCIKARVQVLKEDGTVEKVGS